MVRLWALLVVLLCFGCGDSSPIESDASAGDSGLSDASQSDGPRSDTVASDSASSDSASSDSASSSDSSADSTVDSVASDSTVDSTVDSAPPVGNVNLSFSGSCSPNFGSVLVIYSNGTLGIADASGMPSLQYAFQGITGTVTLSTQHRIQTGFIINLVTGGTTYTNISSTTPDPISGQMIVAPTNMSAGISDVTFNNVTLKNVQSAGLCIINGTVTTSGLSF